jgi:3D-(3,5/4)-trihydroxycyclohexane-1,2-dione acylhydrolase (decyclizing)
MMSQEIVTSIQEGVKIVVIILDNHGFASIGGLSDSLGCERFGTRLQSRGHDGQLSGPVLPINFAENAASLGANSIPIASTDEIVPALEQAAKSDRTTVIVLETCMENAVPNYETWWDVPICETSRSEAIQNARQRYDQQKQEERHFL